MKKILFILFIGLISIKSNGQFINFISRNNPLDTTYGTHYDTLQKGGFRVVWDTLSRNAIPYALRSVNMVVVTQKDSLWWQLIGGISNTNWVISKNKFWDSAYTRAYFDTSGRILHLYRKNGDSTLISIPNSSGATGATNFSFSIVGNTVTETWSNGATNNFDKSDSRIANSDITNWNGKIDSTRAKNIFFTQNGNYFGSSGILGTRDNNTLQFKTNDTSRITISNVGDLTQTNGNWSLGTTGQLSTIGKIYSQGYYYNSGDTGATQAYVRSLISSGGAYNLTAGYGTFVTGTSPSQTVSVDTSLIVSKNYGLNNYLNFNDTSYSGYGRVLTQTQAQSLYGQPFKHLFVAGNTSAVSSSTSN